MNDEELIAATREAAHKLSYYNAAEGQSYRDETQARGKAHTNFHRLKKQCEMRSIDWKEYDEDGRVVGYLI